MLKEEIERTEKLINSMRDKPYRDYSMLTVCEQLLEMIKELAKQEKAETK